MEALKKRLIAHGEKLLIAVILLICLVSLMARLSVPNDELTLPNKKTVRIDRETLRQRLQAVDEIFAKKGNNRDAPRPERISQKLLQEIIFGKLTIDSRIVEWFAYCQPAPIGVPQSFREMERNTPQNIAPEMRTRFGNAQAVVVRATVGQVMITARDAPQLNYPEPDSRQMLIYRKAIGFAKDDLSPELRAVLTVSPRPAEILNSIAAELSGEKAAAPVSKTAPPPKTGGAWGGANVAAAPSNESPTAVEFSLENYRNLVNKKDQQADEELDIITEGNDSLVFDAGWELLTDSMYTVKADNLNESEITTIFTQGLTPDLVEMTPEQLAEYNAKQKKKDEPASANKPTTPTIAAAKVSQRKRIEAVESKTAKTENTQPTINADRPRQYVFVDKTAKENVIYRYAVLAAVRPRKPEEQKIKDWDMYCELVGIDSVGCFAPPQRLLSNVLFVKAKEGEEVTEILPELPFERGRSVKSPRLLEYIKPAYDLEPPKSKTDAPTKTATPEKEGDQETASENGPPARSMRDDRSRLTPLGWAYRNQELCFADFVATDLVLAPKEYDFVLRTGASDKQAMIELYKIELNGDIIKGRLTITAPDWGAHKLKSTDFLVKGADGKVKRPPQWLTLPEVYNNAKFKDIALVPISGEVPNAEFFTPTEATDATAKKTAKKGKANFTTNWGLLDMRPYRVLNVTESRDKKTGDWKKTSEVLMPPQFCAVIAEIKAAVGQPRLVQYLYQPIKRKANTDDKRYAAQILTETEVEIYERDKKKEAAKTATPAEPAK